jgi:flavin-dependent dehydrogenase
MISELTKSFDVIIVGGGLAALTLALQLKRAKNDISILVLERSNEEAPVATHKVGESTSELGAFYLREVLQLDTYLTNFQLRKYGFRFFFSPECADTIANRVEVGSRISDPYPTHQIDRGIFENDLVEILGNLKVDAWKGTRVTEIEINTHERGNHIKCLSSNGEINVSGKWLIDASGRSGFLKRKLNLEEDVDHTINSVWFRVQYDCDIDDWSEDAYWKSLVIPGRRRLATNHLMGEGYWVWIIPLVSGCTSFGIVADPRYHAFEKINTYEKAIQWLDVHEPLAAKMIRKQGHSLLDFR